MPDPGVPPPSPVFALVVVGGGVAAVSCAMEARRHFPAHRRVALVTPAAVIKVPKVVHRITETVKEVAVVEETEGLLRDLGVHVVLGTARSVDEGRNLVHVETPGGAPAALAYEKLCVCTGAAPNNGGFAHPCVLTIRDTESVEDLAGRLEHAQRALVVGNGGVALETVHKLKDVVETVWSFRHGAIGDAFFDADAAEFFADHVLARPAAAPSAAGGKPGAQPAGRKGVTARKGARGPSLGPNWAAALEPALGKRAGREGSIAFYPETELDRLEGSARDGWTATLTDGSRFAVDLVVMATGVTPATGFVGKGLERAADGGIAVNRRMQSSCPNIYAAGDACTVAWAHETPHWFQMRLWTQAEVMGTYAAQCVCGVAESLGLDFTFELFTHVTRFFGMKVVLLGRYNGQGLEHEPEADFVSYTRVLERAAAAGGCCRPGAAAGAGDCSATEATFVRVLLLRGRMQGAVLIGDTDLEETFENLILNGLDLSSYGPQLLDPEIDIEDYFVSTRGRAGRGGGLTGVLGLAPSAHTPRVRGRTPIFV